MRSTTWSPTRQVVLAYTGCIAVAIGTWVAILVFAYAEKWPASVAVVALIQLVPSAIVAPVIAGLGNRHPGPDVAVRPPRISCS